MTQSECFPLHLEVPPILQRLRAQLAVARDCAFAAGRIGGRDTVAQRVQLRDQ